VIRRLLPKSLTIGRPLGPIPARAPDAPRGPDWVQADPARIDAALARALVLPSGGWMVVDASRALGAAPARYTVDGRDLVLWRDGEGRLLAAPDACPHMGASLADGRVDGEGRLVCPWHGLALGEQGFRAWRCLPVHDDGVLTWVRVPGPEAPTEAPILPPRPARHIDAVIRMEAACAPEDVIANRLDPWHGAHLHPYAFAELEVVGVEGDVLHLRVAYRVGGPLRIDVDVTFHCPEPRTIVMTIVRGDGVGSVVETHATPIRPGRTAIVEATLATSDRRGFPVARAMAPLFRPFMRMAARRLWVDDAAYAERRYALRQAGQGRVAPATRARA